MTVKLEAPSNKRGLVISEFQQLAVGDKVRLGPEGYPFYMVAAIEPEQFLLLRAGDPKWEPPSVKDI